MRIFERLPGRAHAAQQQHKRFEGIVAAMAPHNGAMPTSERTSVAVQCNDFGSSSAEAKTQDA
jgi:hypothetical protein